MDTAAEKGSMFGMDEGERLNVGRKNEFFEGKMGQTEGNVGCPESESIASERDRLRTMEMAGQLECGEKCGKTATVEAGLGKVGLKSDIWRETAKRHAARDRGNRPSGTRTGVQGVTPCRTGVQGHCPCLPLPRVRKWVKLASWNANRGPGALPLVGVTWRPSRRRSEPELR